MINNTPHIEIDLISQDGIDCRLENYWQEECKDLKLQIANKIRALEANLEAQPRVEELVDGEQVRSTGLLDFTSLILSITSPAILESVGGIVWETLSKWLDRRNNCKCVIRVDNNEFYLNDLSKAELLEIMAKQIKQP